MSWRVEADCAYGQDIRIEDDLDMVVATIPHGDTDDGEAWALATAALLSAAPELLEACEVAEGVIAWAADNGADGSSIVAIHELLRTAIAKAKGGAA